jgi:hypothetical protein
VAGDEPVHDAIVDAWGWVMRVATDARAIRQIAFDMLKASSSIH